MAIGKIDSSQLHDDDKDGRVNETRGTPTSSTVFQPLIHRLQVDRNTNNSQDVTDYDSDGESHPFISPNSPPSRSSPTSSRGKKVFLNWLGTFDSVCPNRKHLMKLLLNSSPHIEFITWILLFLLNISLWYVTNGMNGISMQSYASSLHERNLLVDPNNTGLTLKDLSLTSVVTYLQLLMGAILGLCILFGLSCFIHRNTQQPQREGQSISFTDTFFQNYPFVKTALTWKTSDLLLSSLHGIGSLATNLGFIYGSASLVQILKLVEPFETLILTKLCSPDESKFLSISIISSMTTVTLSAIALVKQRKATPHPASILFALCSGFALSSRNVLQRRWYSNQEKDKQPKTTSVTKMETKLEEGLSSSKDSMSSSSGVISDATDKPIDSNDVKTTSSGSSSSAPSQLIVRLEQSLIQYTQLSLQSGIMLLVMTLLQQFSAGTFMTVMNSFTFESMSTSPLLLQVSWKVLLWHPLYNVFSMITLGFCSALTHSLLNAGKRVVAILMAIVWFNESFTIRTAVTLFVIALGGIWYVTATTNGAKRLQNISAFTVPWFLEHKTIQPVLCIILIGIVYYQPK